MPLANEASATGGSLLKMGNDAVWGDSSSPSEGMTHTTGTNLVPLEFTGLWSANNAIVSTALSAPTIQISFGGDEETEDVAEEAGDLTPWEGILAFEGNPTGDKRYLMPGEISERDFPLPFMVQTINDEGHKGSELGGRIDSVTRVPIGEFDNPNYDLSDLPDSTIVIWGEGVFDSSEAGQNGLRIIENGGGVSVDMSVSEVQLLDPETFEPVDMEELDIMQILFGGGDFLTGIKGQIMGATALPFPAFEDAIIQVVTASGNGEYVYHYMNPVIGPFIITRTVLTASAAGLAPLAPPREWFEMPESDMPTPLTVTEDGRVYGHLAIWGQCHTGFKEYCQVAPRSRSSYSFFHLGELACEDGSSVGVGKITVGTGHAPITYNSQKALEHYDNTGTVAAFVRAVDGRRGIWLSGAIRSDLPAERIRDLRANPPSGDWRMENGALELQGVLAVVIPGFPVARSEARLVASGADEEMVALVAAGYAPDYPRSRRRKRRMLSERLHKVLNTHIDDFKDYSSEERRKMAKDGRAMPDGSYPIADCTDVANARQAIGRSPANKRSAIRRHIAKRENALSCKSSE